MAAVLAIPLRDELEVKGLLDLLNDPRYQSERREFNSILDHVDELTNRYESIMMKLDAVSEKLSAITDKKNPLAVMVEHMGKVVSGIGEERENLEQFHLERVESSLLM